MKKGLGRKISALAISAILALQLAPMQAMAAGSGNVTANLLQNSGFEEGKASWTNMIDSEVDATQAHSGSQSLHLVVKAGSSKVSQEIGAVAAGEYTFSGYVKGQGYHDGLWYGAALNIEVRDLNGNYLRTVTTGNIDRAENWEKHAVSVEVPEDGAILTAVVSVMAPLTAPTSDFYIDDLSLTGVLAPESMLKNRGFEKGKESWTGASDSDIDTTEAFSGKQSLHLAVKFGSRSVSQEIGAVVAGKYTFSGYVKGQGYHDGLWYGVALNIEVRDTNGNYLKTVTTGNIASANDWEEHSVSIEVPEDGAILTAVISITAPLTEQTSDFYIDSLDFTGVPAAKNMMKNGGFELGTASWTGVNDKMIDTAVSYYGKQSLHLEAKFGSRSVSQEIGKVAEGQYTFSGFIKGQGYHDGLWYGVALNIEVRDLNGNYLRTVTTGNIASAIDWEEHAVTVEVPKEGAILTAVVSIMAPLTEQTSDFHVDSMSFIKN